MIVAHLSLYGWAVKHLAVPTDVREFRLDEVQEGELSYFLSHPNNSNACRRQTTEYFSPHTVNPAVIPPMSSDMDFVAHLLEVCSTHRSTPQFHLYNIAITFGILGPAPDASQQVMAAVNSGQA